MPTKRPFVLTRAGCVGSQRVAATWTGDNGSDARHLRWSLPMALRLGLSGQPFVGPDIGGFVGNATARLYARWVALGAMLPLARAHSAKGTARHEPWSFGSECEHTCRVAIARRYRLLPTIYTAFREAHRSGLPVVMRRGRRVVIHRLRARAGSPVVLRRSVRSGAARRRQRLFAGRRRAGGHAAPLFQRHAADRGRARRHG